MLSLILANLIFLQTQVSISPFLIEQSLAPGARKQFKFSIVNESKWHTDTLLIYPADIIETEDGRYQTVEIGKSVFSCAGWIKVKDSLIILKPNSGVEIAGNIEVPFGVKGGGYGAVVVETKLPPKALEYKTRMSVVLEITIKPPTKPKAIITNIKFDKPENLKQFMLMEKFKDALAVSVSVRNEGDIHLIAKGALTLKNKQGGKIKEFGLGGGRGVILPKTTVDMVSVIKQPPPGEYIMEATVRYGTGSPAKALIPFVISAEQAQTKGNLSSATPLAITINPEIIELNVSPNAFRTRAAILYNEETTDVKVQAEIKELTNDESGEALAVDSGLGKWACSKWIEIDPKEFIIKPGERKPIKLNLQIPADAGQGERYSDIIFNINKETKDTILPTPFSLPVFLTYQGFFREEIKVDSIKLSAIQPVVFNAYLRNTGDMRLKPTGKIILEKTQKLPEMITENIIKIGEFPLKEIKDYVLPDRILIMEADGPPKLEKGKYNIKVEIEYGKGKFSTFAQEIKI
jgi:hypothetical protein